MTASVRFHFLSRTGGKHGKMMDDGTVLFFVIYLYFFGMFELFPNIVCSSRNDKRERTFGQE